MRGEFLLASRRTSFSKTTPEQSAYAHDTRFVSDESVAAGRAAAEVKLDCAKDVNWLLSIQTSSRGLVNKKGHIMKKTIVVLACLLFAPLAFGQPNSTQKQQTTTEPITVTGTFTITTEQGSAAIYQPSKTLVVMKDTPGRYVLDGPGHVVNKNGEVIQTPIRPGARVLIYYANKGNVREIDHVVLD